MRLLGGIIIVLLGVYVLLGVIVFVSQRRILYPAPEPARAPRLHGATLIERLVGTRRVVALHVPAPAAAPTLVHFHGNGEQLADVADLGAEIRAAGLGFYAIEYPGYGLLGELETNEESVYATARAALDLLHDELGTSREHTVLMGQSLGSGAATQMALEGRGARLVLVAPFTSVAAMGRILFPYLPARLLARDRYDNLGKAPRIAQPVLVVHGTRDEVIPYTMGEELSRHFAHGQLLTVPGLSHNDLFADAARSPLAAIVDFARQSVTSPRR